MAEKPGKAQRPLTPTPLSEVSTFFVDTLPSPQGRGLVERKGEGSLSTKNVETPGRGEKVRVLAGIFGAV